MRRAQLFRERRMVDRTRIAGDCAIQGVEMKRGVRCMVVRLRPSRLHDLQYQNAIAGDLGDRLARLPKLAGPAAANPVLDPARDAVHGGAAWPGRGPITLYRHNLLT